MTPARSPTPGRFLAGLALGLAVVVAAAAAVLPLAHLFVASLRVTRSPSRAGSRTASRAT